MNKDEIWEAIRREAGEMTVFSGVKNSRRSLMQGLFCASYPAAAGSGKTVVPCGKADPITDG